jgi:hypothetical protein
MGQSCDYATSRDSDPRLVSRWTAIDFNVSAGVEKMFFLVSLDADSNIAWPSIVGGAHPLRGTSQIAALPACSHCCNEMYMTGHLNKYQR